MIAFQLPSHTPSFEPFCGSAARKNSFGPYCSLLLWMWFNLLIQFQAFFTFKKFIYISSSRIPPPSHPILSLVYYSLFLFSDISMGFGSRKETTFVLCLLFWTRIFIVSLDIFVIFFFLFWGETLLVTSTEGDRTINIRLLLISSPNIWN